MVQEAGNVVFVIVSAGEPEVGIQANESTVVTWVDDDCLEEVRENLRACFEKIHDAPVTVTTSEEMAQVKES